ncbi:MAG: activator of hsp90 ATPase 1 family protein [Cyanobacteria bacterium RYN_339]|nr:activator of hsp90 ATPase 1 family protein [Cyanobacteria bacterium RYN_339]
MTDLSIAFSLPDTPAAAFEALTNPLVLRCWYGAPPGYHRVALGGAFGLGKSLTMTSKNGLGEQVVHTLTVQALGPAEHAVLDLAWDGGPLANATATLSFTADAAGTQVTVHQGPFATEADADAAAAFWRASFGRLARVLAGQTLSPREELANEIKAFHDPLGVAAYGVLVGLREAGAPPEAIASVEDTLYKHLAELPAETGDMIDGLMRARLAVLDAWRAAEAAPPHRT